MPNQERNLFNDYQIHDFFSFKNQAIEMLRKQCTSGVERAAMPIAFHW